MLAGTNQLNHIELCRLVSPISLRSSPEVVKKVHDVVRSYRGLPRCERYPTRNNAVPGRTKKRPVELVLEERKFMVLVEINSSNMPPWRSASGYAASKRSLIS
jgi:hypothetical protein